MDLHAARFWGITVIFLALAGCKIQISVPEGGKVKSLSGAYVCQAGQVCLIDIYDLYFEEEFVAVPDTGYKFVEWEKVDGGLCVGKATPCKIVSAPAKSDAALMILLESDAIFLLKPVFEPLAGADLGIRLRSYGYKNRYCNWEGKIDYELDVWNYGPNSARDVVVTFQEEAFELPGGWQRKGTCKKQSGKISCPLGDLDSTSPGHNAAPSRTLRFFSKTFKNRRHTRHRVKFTVSAGSLDPDPTNNIYFWEWTIPSFIGGWPDCDDSGRH